MLLKAIVLFLAIFAAEIYGIGDESAAVKGKLVCEGKPKGGVSVKLYDEDTLKDDTMAKGTTDANGEYHLSGYASDPIGSIEAKVKIENYKCGHWTKKCYKFNIPSSYVNHGKTPKKTFDAGVIDLASVKHNC